MDMAAIDQNHMEGMLQYRAMAQVSGSCSLRSAGSTWTAETDVLACLEHVVGVCVYDRALDRPVGWRWYWDTAEYGRESFVGAPLGCRLACERFQQLWQAFPDTAAAQLLRSVVVVAAGMATLV